MKQIEHASNKSTAAENSIKKKREHSTQLDLN